MKGLRRLSPLDGLRCGPTLILAEACMCLAALCCWRLAGRGVCGGDRERSDTRALASRACAWLPRDTLGLRWCCYGERTTPTLNVGAEQP